MLNNTDLMEETGGHEGTGIVAAVGENVHDVAIGQRVGIQVREPIPIQTSRRPEQS